MTTTTLSLIARTNADDVVAWRHGEAITLAQFLRDIMHCANGLPTRAHVLNLCNDRYLFAVGLFASIVKHNVSLLPNATSHELVANMTLHYPDLCCLTDPDGDARGLPQCIVSTASVNDKSLPIVPQIDAAQRVAKVFTSGSTGEPQAHEKTWGKLNRIVAGGAQALWHIAGAPATVIGTVPSQHMYGFESTILMPLLGGGCLHSGRPFFPADIVASLAAAPRPRALVTTPFHLKTLIESALPLPAIDLIVSATAPLSRALAERAEQAFAAPLMEIYGSTETGQLATRRPVVTAQWCCYAGIRLEERGAAVWASGGHLEMPIALSDVLELHDESHFILLGRHSDMVNIAGKRTSLAYLTYVLNSLPGVVDGAFHLPEEEPADGAARLHAFVVAPGLAAQDILAGLREHIDPAFMPRPLVFVDALPRNSTGKVTAATLKMIAAQHAEQAGSVQADSREQA